MNKILSLLVAIPMLFMVGCADEFDVAMVEKHMNAEIEIAKAKAAAIDSKSEAIALTITENSTDLERYLAREQIASLEVTESGLKSITTGNDVAVTLTQDGKVIVRDIVTGAVVYRGIVGLTEALANSGDTNIVNEGDGNVVDYTKNDTKQIVAGENNVANNSNSSGGSSGSGEELSGDCDEKVATALEGYDLNAINLGGLMRELAAETGCVVEISGGQVIVKETGNPIESVNSKWASHPELSGAE